MALDFIEKVNSLKADRQDFILSPKQWGKLELNIDLEWKRIKFNESNKRYVPESAGIYSFVVSNRDKRLPAHGYIMYIGIVGHRSGSSRNLKKRYVEYIYEEKKLKRPTVHVMLKKWKNYIEFHYVELSPEQYDLKEVEKKLCGALIPPCNQNDFEAELKPIIKAAWL